MTSRALAVAVGLIPSIAASPADNVDIVGGGIDSCGTWMADRKVPGLHGFQREQWVLGYLSAVAVWALGGLDPMKGVDGEARGEAADALWRELVRRATGKDRP